MPWGLMVTMQREPTAQSCIASASACISANVCTSFTDGTPICCRPTGGKSVSGLRLGSKNAEPQSAQETMRVYRCDHPVTV